MSLPMPSSAPMMGAPPMQQQQPSSGGGVGSPNPNDAPDPCNLIVNYIPTPVTDAELYAMFAQYGELVSARVIADRQTGHPKGYGFVKYKNMEDANTAMLRMNGFAIHGKRFKVTPARGYQSASIDAYTAQRGPGSAAPPGPGMIPLGPVVQGGPFGDMPMGAPLGSAFAPGPPIAGEMLQGPASGGAQYSGPSFGLPSSASQFNSSHYNSAPSSLQQQQQVMQPMPTSGAPISNGPASGERPAPPMAF